MSSLSEKLYSLQFANLGGVEDTNSQTEHLDRPRDLFMDFSSAFTTVKIDI